MMEARRLYARLNALESKLREERLFWRLAVCWIAAAAAELLVLGLTFAGWNMAGVWWAVLFGAFLASWLTRRRALSKPLPLPWGGQFVDYAKGRGAPKTETLPARRFEVIDILTRQYPEIRHLLPAAAEQKPNPETGELGYLQLRVIEEALNHPAAREWREMMERKARTARRFQALALAALFAIFYFGHGVRHPSRSKTAAAAARPLFSKEIEVLPGDAELEKGSGLVISARFGKPPAEASLVVVSESGQTRRLAMARALSDPVFAASLAEVAESAVYRIEYAGRKTRDFKIRVFEYPALVRADAELAYPPYTGLTNRTIRDTLRVSAVEGAKLKYALQFNKPVAQALLAGLERSISLAVNSNAAALFDAGALTNSARYSLRLIDSEGRTNKAPAELVIQVLPNRPPELKIVFPIGDQRVSPIEELDLRGEARDDFGLLKYGIGFGAAGKEPQFIELGQSAPANEKRPFAYQVDMETLGLAEDQLLSYFAWAEDYGPDGEPRRSFSDIYFAEVRPFEEIFRQDPSGASERESRDQNPNQGASQGQGNNNPRLAELQKDIVVATWKLQQARAAPKKGGKP